MISQKRFWEILGDRSPKIAQANIPDLPVLGDLADRVLNMHIEGIRNCTELEVQTSSESIFITKTHTQTHTLFVQQVFSAASV